ncbi:hypothetical protein JIN78_05370 [Roseibacillus ishigakijimensis]|uniref:Uncharacterized protein n=1 Tax=Roseibacillus ishigakijimensis TaxID=454146 RepID=A0A934RPJ7_9BACT|nr:hypothetical protein [Roseibacillus ishigakijimensis]
MVVRSDEVLLPVVEDFSLSERWSLSETAALRLLRERTQVQKSEKGGNRLLIVVRAPDARLTRDLVAAIGESYRNVLIERGLKREKRALDALERELAEQRDQVARKRERLDVLLREIQEKNGQNGGL